MCPAPSTQPKKAKRVDLAPWWSYVLLVTLSLLFLMFLSGRWARLPAVFLDGLAWVMFFTSNKHEKAIYDVYLPWSLVVLSIAILLTLFILP